MRTIALTKLGKLDQALDSVDATLSRNPEDAFAHANKGWSLLHQRQPRLALESFREALRINALSTDQRKASNWFAVCLLGSTVAAVFAITTDNGVAMIVALVSIGLALPLVTIYDLSPGWPRTMMTCFATAMAICGSVGLASLLLASPYASAFFWLFVIGFIVTPLLANVLVQVTAPE